MTGRQDLETAQDALFQSERFKDYCPNGLQVKGCGTVRKIASGVAAVGTHIAAQLGLEHGFIGIDNPA